MNNDKVTSLLIPKKLLRLAQEYYGDVAPSTAVISVITDFVTLSPKQQVLDYSKIANHANLQDKHLRKLSVRISPALLNMVIEIRNKNSAILLKNSNSEVIGLMISVVCTATKTGTPQKIINLMGSKWDSRMQKAIQHIFSTCNKHWSLSVETCAGALGIHSSVNVADKKVLNDLDYDKMNLYRCIQNNPRKLLNLATSYSINRETFTELKKKREQIMRNMKNSSRPDYDYAVQYLYLNINSYRNQLNTFADNSSQQKFFCRLRQIMYTHELLDGVSLQEKDIFKILQKYEQSFNTLFIVDPPYLNCSSYENSNFRTFNIEEKHFGLQEHRKLAKKLQKAVSNGNDFIYFCRTTATRKKNKLNQIVMTSDQIREADNTMQYYIDRLYKGNRFYYLDVELDDGIIERIITSFPFPSGKEY